MKLTVIGTGYVGLVSGACLADVGNQVLCLDLDAKKIDLLKSGGIPIYEPGLKEIVANNVAAGRLRFTTNIEESVAFGDIQMIAVGTPPGEDGSADLQYVVAAARNIGRFMTGPKIVMDKSTVPVGTADRVREAIAEALASRQQQTKFSVVSNPEFLKEGAAVEDFMRPDRIVIGGNSERAIALMQKIYEPFMSPVLVTDINSAELIKHAANSFLALKISYINAVARICEASGADVEKVADGIGTDRRIGRNFLNAGIGYGGSCFPKDIAAFIAISEDLGVPFTLLKEVEKINRSQREMFIAKIREALWVLKDKKIAVWGLTFKPDTDDVRSSVAIDVVRDLVAEGAQVSAYDPKGMEKAVEFKLVDGARLATSPIDAANGAEALIIATEWKEFTTVDLKELQKVMHTPLIFDGRNIMDPKTVRAAGFQYTSIGRS